MYIISMWLSFIELQLSTAIKIILNPSDNCDEQGVLLYNLDAIIAVGYRDSAGIDFVDPCRLAPAILQKS